MRFGFSVLGITLAFVGILLIAGSANDCDGTCPENANTLWQMFQVLFVGLGLSAFGGWLFYRSL